MRKTLLLLLVYSYLTPKNPYGYKTYMMSETKSFPVSDRDENKIKEQYSSLNSSPLFQVKNISQNLSIATKELKRANGEFVKLYKDDCAKATGWYIKRGSKKAVVIAPGFRNDCRIMSCFSEIYKDCDVFLLNYRGHGIGYCSNLYIASHTGLGALEHEDVSAAAQYLREQGCEQVVGHGICFGAFAIAKAQSLNSNLFDQLVLDGLWTDIMQISNAINKNSGLIKAPQKGKPLKEPFNTIVLCGLAILATFVKYRRWISYDNIKVDMSKITIPTLIFYGKDDQLIQRCEFEDSYNAIQSNAKMACITSNEHVWNHLKQKEFYAYLCNLFTQPNGTGRIIKDLY